MRAPNSAIVRAPASHLVNCKNSCAWLFRTANACFRDRTRACLSKLTTLKRKAISGITSTALLMLAGHAPLHSSRRLQACSCMRSQTCSLESAACTTALQRPSFLLPTFQKTCRRKHAHLPLASSTYQLRSVMHTCGRYELCYTRSSGTNIVRRQRSTWLLTVFLHVRSALHRCTGMRHPRCAASRLRGRVTRPRYSD